MKARIENDTLYVEMAINNPPTPSASGKTLIVASSQGNKTTEVTIQGKPLIIGLNAYIKRD